MELEGVMGDQGSSLGCSGFLAFGELGGDVRPRIP